MRYVRDLAGVRSSDVPLVGGKGANLGELLSLGFTVPRGFCVTTHAYRDFVSSAGLGPRIQEVVASADVARMDQVQSASRTVRGLFLRNGMGDGLAQEVLEAYERLGAPAVSVRSSATSEDTPEASFAGQHSTFLNVTGRKQLLESLMEVWASLWTPWAICYRAQHGFEHGQALMALVVQEMVPAEVSGVLFTADARDPSQMVVNATYGLGEALVSGAVTPDRLTLAREGLAVREKVAGSKTFLIKGAEAGGTERQPVPAEARDELCLTTEQASDLGRIGARLEEHFGSHQDVEWAISQGQIHLLQSRPLALADRERVSWESPVPGAKWLRAYRIGEWLADPVTPFFATTLLPWLAAGRENKGFTHLGWRRGNASGFGIRMQEPPFTVVNGYYFARLDPDPSSRGRMHEEPGVPPSFRGAMMVARLTVWFQRWHRVHLPKYREHLESQGGYDVSRATSPELFLRLDRLSQDAGALWFLLAPTGFSLEEMLFGHLYKEYVRGDDAPPMPDLFSGFDSKPLEGERALRDISRDINADPELLAAVQGPPHQVPARLESTGRGRLVLGKIQDYRREYGHQVHTFDLYFPTLGERSETVVQTLQAYLEHDPPDHGDDLAQLALRRRRATSAVLSKVRQENPDVLVPFRKALRWFQLSARVREDIAFYLQKGWPLMRATVAEMGRRLAEVGVIEDRDQVHFLERGEVSDALEAVERPSGTLPRLAALASERRETWEWQRNLVPPPQIPPAEDSLWGEWAGRSVLMVRPGLVRDRSGPRLVGQPASPGRVSGPARVLTSLEDFGKLGRGEVLVTVATNPAWTPLFPLASAVVTEVGGGASHSSLVAREHGIPCVVGTGVATRVIHDGQIVTVDGTEGVVYL